MEPWEQDALNSFGQRFARPTVGTPPGEPSTQPQPGMDVAGPAQMPQQSGGMLPPGMGQTIKDEVLSGPAGYLGHGMVRGAANLGDSALNAGQWLTGNEMTSPLGDMVKQHVDPHFATATSPGVIGGISKGFRAAGELAAPGVAGVKAVNALAGAGKKIAPGMSRLMDSFQRFGTGAAPLPGAGRVANTAARVGTGAAATGTAALAGDPSNPQGAATAAALGGVAGPVLNKAGEVGMDAVNMGMNALSKSRVPHLRDQVIREVAGNRGPQILNNLGQAPNRITPGLPHQVAADPGISSLHRTLAGAQPTRYGAKTTDFMEGQRGDLAANLKSQSRDLENLRTQRDVATKPIFDLLNTSQQPVSTNMISRKAFSQIEPGGALHGSQQGRHLLSAAKPLITKHSAGQAMAPVLPSGKGLLKEAPAGVLANIKQDINGMLRPDFVPGKGKLPIDAKGKALLLDFKSALDEALNRASPAKGNASQLNRQANRTYQKMSVPVNQTERVRELYDDSLSGVLSLRGDKVIEPTLLANKIRDLEAKPAVWNQFTTAQKNYLQQIQKEAPGDVNAANYGAGTASQNIAGAAVPKAVLSSTRPLPGPSGRAASVVTKLVAGRQIGRVEDALAEIMSEPGGIQTIEQILRSNPKALSEATGITAKRLQQFMAASVSMAPQ